MTALRAQARVIRFQELLSESAPTLDPARDLFSSETFEIAKLADFIMAVVALLKWRAERGPMSCALLVVALQARIGSMSVENRKRTRRHFGAA